jgi:hypothetical protein
MRGGVVTEHAKKDPFMPFATTLYLILRLSALVEGDASPHTELTAAKEALLIRKELERRGVPVDRVLDIQ